jgi:hypothetical protein
VFELVGKTATDGSRIVVVRTNLNGTYLDFCKIGTKNQGKWDCPLKKFVETVNDMVVEDFKNSCYLPPAEKGFRERMLGWAGW